MILIPPFGSLPLFLKFFAALSPVLLVPAVLGRCIAPCLGPLPLLLGSTERHSIQYSVPHSDALRFSALLALFNEHNANPKHHDEPCYHQADREHD
jgi:hypothetical protein